MADASHVVTSFLGGEISQFAQGRFDRPDYHISLNVCQNAFPVEIGAWTRRPGSQYAGHTRGGAKGRTIKFDFEQSSPVTLEFTDLFLRFRNGAMLISTNDAQSVVSVSTANPAIVQTAAAHGWSTGNTVFLPGASTPLLENRQFTITVTDSKHFSIADAVTGANVDGSTLSALVAGATVKRVQELATSYLAGLWSSVRAVQAETTDILLHNDVAPQVLTVTTLPSGGVDPVFAINPAVFVDGPYLDPFTNGAQITPGSASGIITLTVSFQSYSASQAYTKGAFVTSSSVNYISLQDQNAGNTPASSPSFWQATTPNAAINNGKGFLGTDIGRLIRLFNEPILWSSTTAYVAGNIVSYNPSGIPGAATYWTSLTSNTGAIPGNDTTNWQLTPNNAAIWTWGKITSLSNSLAGATGTNVGTMTGGGGLAGAFNGNPVQSSQTAADQSISGSAVANGTVFTLSSYVGKNYTGGAQQIEHVTIYPTIDWGLGAGAYSWNAPTLITSGSGRFVTYSYTNVTYSQSFAPTFVLNLRGKSTAPASSSDGTLLATSGSIVNTTAPITLISSDQVTAYNYVWVELVSTFVAVTGGPFFSNTGLYATLGLTPPPFPTSSYGFTNTIGQLQFFNPPGTGSTSGVNVEILGPALIHITPVRTWRLGAFSNTTGWPTCGCYDGGRLFLGGAIPNRWDASVSNGISGTTINFAPTDQNGVVSASSAISYTFNSDSVNPIFWMIPDLQGVLMGTLAGEWLVEAPTAGPLAPTNVAARRVTTIGCSNIEPRRTEHTIAFIKRYGRKIMEYFADVFSGKFTAPNLADKAQHITSAGVAEIAYTEAVTPIIWGRDTAGALFGITYKRDALTTSQGPTYAAFHRHPLGTGRTVESICSGPSVDGLLDTLTMVTSDTAVRHVEILTDTPDELASLTSAWFLDDAVNPTSVSSSTAPTSIAPYGGLTINGLWHLNGLTAQVFAGGLDCGNQGDSGTTPTDFLVTNGSVFVPFGDGVSAGSGGGLFTAAFAAGLSLTQIVVGLTYNSDGQLVRPVAPQETGARSGPAFSKVSRMHRFGAQLVNTLGISFGTSFNELQPAILVQADDITPIPSLTMYSGMHHDTVADDYSRFDRKLCWRVSRPFPATVVAIGPSLATQDQ